MLALAAMEMRATVDTCKALTMVEALNRLAEDKAATTGRTVRYGELLDSETGSQ